VRKDGSRFWSNVVITALHGSDGELRGFLKITRDLTERRRNEERLRESEERFRLLVSSVADYAIFLLDTEGCVASWNLGAERLKGYRPEEIVGRHLATFYTEEDRRAQLPQKAIEHARTHGTWQSEGWRVRKDGSRFWAHALITALRGSDGELRGFAKVTRDLTERKRSDDALRGVLERERAAAAQMRDLERMRTDLVSTIAHDLRAPVGVLEVLLHLLVEDWGESTLAEKRDLIDRAGDRVRILSALVDDVFDLVSIEAGHLEVQAGLIDVRAIVDAVVADASMARPDAKIAVTGARDVRAIGDHLRTRQILANLVSNAVKFSPSGSPVEVDLSQTADAAVVSVRDRGEGIAEEHQEQIFERFARLPEAANVPGSGLGLYIARTLAEAQQGSLGVDSEPGEGATFRFTLPLAVPDGSPA